MHRRSKIKRNPLRDLFSDAPTVSRRNKVVERPQMKRRNDLPIFYVRHDGALPFQYYARVDGWYHKPILMNQDDAIDLKYRLERRYYAKFKIGKHERQV